MYDSQFSLLKLSNIKKSCGKFLVSSSKEQQKLQNFRQSLNDPHMTATSHATGKMHLATKTPTQCH